MRVLLLVSGVGPAEARILENAHDHGHQVDVMEVTGPSWLRRSAPQDQRSLYRWATYWPLRTARNQVARLLRHVVERGAYDAIFSSSLPAAGFAARYLEEEFVPLLWRGDLDFTPAREQLTEDVLDLTTAVDRLFLQDEYEFDKALSKSSRSAHLLHLSGVGSGDPPIELLLGRPGHAPKVALLHPERVTAERLAAQAELLRPVAESRGGTLHTLSASALYRARDLRSGRWLSKIAATRLGEFTHVVLVGTSRDHESVADLLLEFGAGSRLIVEDTIGMGQWARMRGFGRTGRGARLAVMLDDLLVDTTSDDGAQAPVRPEPDPSSLDIAETPDSDVLRSYVKTMAEPVARDFEQLRVVQGSWPMDVFFSTSPLEDRTNGARPQRVRNMAEALDVSGAAVRLYSVPEVFRRRAALVRRLLAEGRPAGILYGENSTSPIPNDEIVDELADLIRDVRHHGGRTAWFVRDLHWLEQLAGYLEEPGRREQFQRRGLRELEDVGGAADVLAAPGEAAGQGFNALLQAHGQAARQWYSMPPAVAPQNTVDRVPTGLVEDPTSVTLLYAGGVSSLYGLEEYMEALSSVQSDVCLDFVVRPDEIHHLEQMLDRHGLRGRRDLRILTESLEWYEPTTSHCIGAVLLGGEYARFSFPYKTVSLIERGFPILCFDDMAIASFVTDRRVGVATGRGSEQIQVGLERLMHEGAPGMAEVQREQTWVRRLEDLRDHLERVSSSGRKDPREPSV